MTYRKLATELLQKMRTLHKTRPHQDINPSLRGEMFILCYIASHNVAVLPSDISRKMNASSAQIAAALNNLENKGLITRQIDTDDRRKILVEITQKGNDLAQKRQRLALDVIEKMLKLLGEHDAQEYVRITGKLADAINEQPEL